MDIKSMVQGILDRNDWEGLVNTDAQCGCPKSAISPGFCITENCEAADTYTCPVCFSVSYFPIRTNKEDYYCVECGYAHRL